MLPPEEYFGNIEYKQSIINKNNNRLEELATQMNFRLNEGNGTATYFLGINDDGSVSNIYAKDMLESLKNLKKFVRKQKQKLLIFKILIIIIKLLFIEILKRNEIILFFY